MNRRHDSRDDEDSGDEERPEEKPPSTKKTLQDPRTLRRPVQYCAESFDEHYSYERFIQRMLEVTLLSITFFKKALKTKKNYKLFQFCTLYCFSS
ncbi:hypothetical protein AVEN_187661-1 [Araneus ventricosus]|uniref:Uncharacterized protein n=1 Tax=Araneus ventricosus TaxID=182803 RepID=A0A4Y2UE10_ARAVE|nr:hypothetical protein AVEN_187661-1 [Araneus ventricosus]